MTRLKFVGILPELIGYDPFFYREERAIDRWATRSFPLPGELMSAAKEVPVPLLRAILEDTKRANGPHMPHVHRTEAEVWLLRVLLCNEDWLSHLSVLRQIMNLSPSPHLNVEGESRSEVRRMIEAVHLEFPSQAPLSEDKVDAILDQGLEGAADETVAELLLNPIALELLRAMVTDEPSEAWVRERTRASSYFTGQQ